MNPYTVFTRNASSSAFQSELSFEEMISSAAYHLVLAVERLIEAIIKR